MSAHSLKNCQPTLLGWLKQCLGDRSFVHTAVLALVWCAAATSGIVFSEPCPTDILTICLMVLLPTVGLFRFGPAISALMLVLSGAAAFSILATLSAVDTAKALTHTAVSIYLYAATILLAGFIAAKPEAHTKLIFNGLCFAAAIAAAFGIGGYFGLIPSHESFTKFGRASGTFKDPNVFGPFLVAPLLYSVHSALEKPMRASLLRLLFAGFLAVAVLLSFSRGAWINLLVAVGVFLALTLVTAKTQAHRQKIVLLSLFGAGLMAVSIIAALQIDSVSKLLSDRASVTHSYDVGPEGRFGGQEKAVSLILEHPLGIGAAQFAIAHHHEEAHNVYLSVTMSAGWFGVAFYLIAVLSTLLVGFRYVFRDSSAQPYLIIAVAVFAANVGEGMIIDTDHWRHFYLMMAMIWGIATAPEVSLVAIAHPMRRMSDHARRRRFASA